MPMPDRQSPELLVRAAWLYYQENLTQEQLACRLGVSRQKAQRLLSEARDRGIVHVRIRHPSANLLAVEGDLRERWGLRDALVAPCAGEESVTECLGRAAAGYLERALGACRTLGVGLGRTLHAMSRHFAPEPPPQGDGRRVVAVMGNLLGTSAINPYGIGERLAERWRAEFYSLWAPAIVRDRQTAHAFRSEPWIQNVLEMGSRADLVVSGLGTALGETTLEHLGYLTDEELRRLAAKGAVGSILGQYFGADGRLLEDEIHERVIAVPLAGLRDRGGAVLVAGGESKRQALAAALRGGYARVLITDEASALWLLEQETA